MSTNTNTEKIESQDKGRFFIIDFNDYTKILTHPKSIYLLHFYVYLLSLSTTNKHNVIGVYKQLKFTMIKTMFEETNKLKTTKTQIMRYFKLLEELGIIKIYDRGGNYLITITNHFNTLEDLLEYVKSNEEEFQFHIHTNRKKQFFQHYKLFDKTEKATAIKKEYAESQILPELKTEPIDYDPFEETAEDLSRRKKRENRANLSFPRR